MQFFLLNMFMAVIMDTYADVNSEIDGNSGEFEMAGFLLCYFKSILGGGSEFQAGEEIWRKTKEKKKSEEKRSVQENCDLLKEQRKLLKKKMKALVKLDKEVGKSELDFTKLWTSHCSFSEIEPDKELKEFLSAYLCHRVRVSFDLSIRDDYA